MNYFNNPEGFIKDNKIKHYTYREIERVYKSMGFVVLNTRDSLAQKYAEIMDISIADYTECFICNKAGVKAVFLDMSQNNDIKTFDLLFLVLLADCEDSRKCEKEQLYKCYYFASRVKDVLITPEIQSKAFRFLRKYGMNFFYALFTALTAVCLVIYYIFDSQNEFDPSNFAGIEIVSTDGDSELFQDDFTFDSVGNISNASLNNTDNKGIHNAEDTENIEPNIPVNIDVGNAVSVDQNIISDYVTEKEIDFDDSKHESSNENTNEVFYYATKSGTKYHTADCRFIKDANSTVKLSSEDVNSNSKYSPCKVCINK